MNTLAQEPVAVGGSLTAIAVAAIPVLRAFGVNVTEDQATAVLGLLAALIAFGTLLIRSLVTPVEKANDVINAAYIAQSGDPKPSLN
jgi:hypothetical protein